MLATSVLLAIPGSLGLGQAQYPALRLLGTDQFGCPHRLGSQIPPAPQVGHGLAPGLNADAAADPGRRHLLRLQLRVVAHEDFGVSDFPKVRNCSATSSTAPAIRASAGMPR